MRRTRGVVRDEPAGEARAGPARPTVAGRAADRARPGSQNDALRLLPAGGGSWSRAAGAPPSMAADDHRISGVAQQQSGSSSLAFTSQHGPVRLESLREVKEGQESRRGPGGIASHGPGRRLRQDRAPGRAATRRLISRMSSPPRRPSCSSESEQKPSIGRLPLAAAGSRPLCTALLDLGPSETDVAQHAVVERHQLMDGAAGAIRGRAPPQDRPPQPEARRRMGPIGPGPRVGDARGIHDPVSGRPAALFLSRPGALRPVCCAPQSVARAV